MKIYFAYTVQAIFYILPFVSIYFIHAKFKSIKFIYLINGLTLFFYAEIMVAFMICLVCSIFKLSENPFEIAYFLAYNLIWLNVYFFPIWVFSLINFLYKQYYGK